jgi:hypothetical protein
MPDVPCFTEPSTPHQDASDLSSLFGDTTLADLRSDLNSAEDCGGIDLAAIEQA